MGSRRYGRAARSVAQPGARGRQRRRPRVKLRRAEPSGPIRKPGRGPRPAQPVDVDADGRVASQRGEHAEQDRPIALLGERRGQPSRAAHGDVPVGGQSRNRLQVPVAREHRRRGCLPPPRQSGVAVGAVTHEREPVGNRFGQHAELLRDAASSRRSPVRRSSWTIRSPRTHCDRSLSGVHTSTWLTRASAAAIAAPRTRASSASNSTMAQTATPRARNASSSGSNWA